MDEIQAVEYFERLWAKWPRGKPFTVFTGRAHVVILACQIQSLQVVIQLLIGPRKGISQECMIVDPRPRIVADRLVLSLKPRWDNDYGPLNLSDLREKVAKGGDQVDVCQDALVAFRKELEVSTRDFKADMRLLFDPRDFLEKFSWQPAGV